MQRSGASARMTMSQSWAGSPPRCRGQDVGREHLASPRQRQDVMKRVPAEGRAEREQLVEEAADPEDVGALVDLVVSPPGLLRRHIGGRATTHRGPPRW